MKLNMKYGLDEGVPSVFIQTGVGVGVFIYYCSGFNNICRKEGFKFDYNLGIDYSRGSSEKLTLKELYDEFQKVKKWDGYQSMNFSEEDLLKLIKETNPEEKYLNGIELFISNKILAKTIKKYGINSKQVEAILKLYKD